MILKFRTTIEGNCDKWNYIDGIVSCGVFYDTKEKCTMVEFKDNGGIITLALQDEAYLINDNGKTIEKIAH